MLANSLIMGVITYAASIVYNLLARKSLETVFYLGLRFLIYTTFMFLFFQLSYYLVKDLYFKDRNGADNKDEEKKKNDNSKAESKKQSENTGVDNQEFEESAIDNEFENQEFSAFNPEDFEQTENNNQ